MPFPNQTLGILRQSILRCELTFEGKYWQNVSATANSSSEEITTPGLGFEYTNQWMMQVIMGRLDKIRFTSQTTLIERESTRGLVYVTS